MNERRAGHETVPFPVVRRAITDFLNEGHRKHTIHALTEFDVTQARHYIRAHKQATGESLSFTAFLIVCLAKAVAENKNMHAYRKGRGQLVLFDDVDVAVPVEREVMEHRMAATHVVRAANRKTFREVHQEIRAAQAQRVEERSDFKRMALIFSLPSFVRRVIWRRIVKDPYRWKKLAGTVATTSPGMFGGGGGWGIPITNYTLGVTLGGIAEKPGAVDGQIRIREYLSMTVSVDHDIVDGAPLARFLSRLKELVEGGYGLPEVEEGE